MISPTKRGMCVEYLAITAFIEAGWEVFHNASSDGPADFVVWDGNNTYLIDAKKLTKYVRGDGTPTYRAGKSSHPDVLVLGWHQDGWFWLSELPQALKGVL